MGVGPLPGAGQPLLPLQQSLIRQSAVLQPNHLLHVHANQTPSDRSDISGRCLDAEIFLTLSVADFVPEKSEQEAVAVPAHPHCWLYDSCQWQRHRAQLRPLQVRHQQVGPGHRQARDGLPVHPGAGVVLSRGGSVQRVPDQGRGC